MQFYVQELLLVFVVAHIVIQVDEKIESPVVIGRPSLAERVPATSVDCVFVIVGIQMHAGLVVVHLYFNGNVNVTRTSGIGVVVNGRGVVVAVSVLVTNCVVNRVEPLIVLVVAV